jgi:hypothetical protein
VATVEIVGAGAGMSCLTPVLIGEALSCQYIVSVPPGYDPITVSDLVGQVYGADGEETSGDLVSGDGAVYKGGSKCTGMPAVCTLPGGSSISFAPSSFYTVSPDDYVLPAHLLQSSVTLDWIADCNHDTAQCTGSNEVGFVSTVQQYTPSLSTELTPSGSVTAGTAVTDQATLNGASPDAGGTVSYAVFSDDMCANQVASLGSEAVSDGTADPSSPWTATEGSYWFQATYSGDPADQGPISSACSSEPLTVLAGSALRRGGRRSAG